MNLHPPSLRFPMPVEGLIESLRKLPGIGPRSAERIALWLLQEGRSKAFEQLQSSLTETQSVKLCEQCGFFISLTEHSPTSTSNCPACDPTLRAANQLCVVEQPTEVLALERTGEYRGCYHCLGGKLAPLDDIGPEDLRLSPLWQRLGSEELEEVILATSSDVEGEATASYLSEQIRARGYQVKISRPAQGLPAGGGLQGADPLTLIRALTGRQQVAK